MKLEEECSVIVIYEAAVVKMDETFIHINESIQNTSLPQGHTITRLRFDFEDILNFLFKYRISCLMLRDLLVNNLLFLSH